MPLLIDAGGQIVIRDFVKLAYYKSTSWEIGIDKAGAGEITYSGGHKVHVQAKNGIGGDILFNDADFHSLSNALGVSVKKLAGLNIEFSTGRNDRIFIKIALQKDLKVVSAGFSVEIGTSIKEIFCLHSGLCNAYKLLSWQKQQARMQKQEDCIEAGKAHCGTLGGMQ
jgi:hypothetical protein